MNLRESPSEQGNVSLSPLKLFLGRNCFEINFTSKLAEMLKFNMTLNHDVTTIANPLTRIK
ncbi:uncharacterized protein [Physcomitrium patens]|uniref:uncharacterized protein isoform X11 n=1 Tax=Physcomitrium patens TaxID=3218 RepID=UPI003CCE0A32